MFGGLDQEEGDGGFTGTTHETVAKIDVASDSVLERRGVISSAVPDVARPEPEDANAAGVPTRSYPANEPKDQHIPLPPPSPSLSTVSDEEEVNRLLLLHEDSVPSSPSVPFVPPLVAPAHHTNTSPNDILAVSHPTTAIADTNALSTRAEVFETERELEIENDRAWLQISTADPLARIDSTNAVSISRSGSALEHLSVSHTAAPGIIGAAANNEGARHETSAPSDPATASSVFGDAPEPFTEAQIHFIDKLIRDEVDRCAQILASASASAESSSKRDISNVDFPSASDTGQSPVDL